MFAVLFALGCVLPTPHVKVEPDDSVAGWYTVFAEWRGPWDRTYNFVWESPKNAVVVGGSAFAPYSAVSLRLPTADTLSFRVAVDGCKEWATATAAVQ